MRSTGRPGNVRIIAGRWRGRRLAIPPGAAVRPTPDRVRETLFNWLRDVIEGARCLDLFAGTGVLGFEALSRGARDVLFVEQDAALARSIEAQGARLQTSVRLRRVAAQTLLREPAAERFDVVFLDPPYTMPLAPLLERLPPWLASGAYVYVERPTDQPLPETSPVGPLIKRSRAGRVHYGLLRAPTILERRETLQ